jgi:small subunit ribosomal protein S8
MFLDPIANLVINIKNAINANQKVIVVNHSTMLEDIVKVLKEQGYINEYTVIANPKNSALKQLEVTLRYEKGLYSRKNAPAITGIKQVSKPGLKIYKNVINLPRVLNDLGIAVVSTNKGVITNKAARNLKVGGEVLLYV